MQKILPALLIALFIAGCNPARIIAQTAREEVYATPPFASAHTGISIYDPATKIVLYDYQGDKYFVPASNIKIATCYAAMKYLGDSLEGVRYAFLDESAGPAGGVVLLPTGDPTFLHPDYQKHPVLEALRGWSERGGRFLYIDSTWKDRHWGSGWAWTDYDAAYMAERSPFPMYGNVIDIRLLPPGSRTRSPFATATGPSLFRTQHPFFDSLVNKNTGLLPAAQWAAAKPNLQLTRSLGGNDFYPGTGMAPFQTLSLPFVTKGGSTTLSFLQDTLKTSFCTIGSAGAGEAGPITPCPDKVPAGGMRTWKTISSQPTDSVLRPMMHRSDNFFAEQSLLMVSGKLLGQMQAERLVDTLLKTDFSDLPQKPRWADGSGLSRYNLFSPRDFIAILEKMKNEFGMERVKGVFATGNQGTLAGYYKQDSGSIYAKTGTLSGVVALSGFLYTKKNKLLLFSVLVNNHQSSASTIRRSIEGFLHKVREEN